MSKKVDLNKPLTFICQQWHECRRQGQVEIIYPRVETSVDLTKNIKAEKSKGREIILLIDANEGINNKNSQTRKMMKEYGLESVHEKKHGRQAPPT